MASNLSIMKEITNEGSGEGEGCLMQAVWITNIVLLLINVIVWGNVLWVL
jgi:hypothetical protein